MNSRRNFIKGSAVVGAGITLAPNLVFPFNRRPATDRLKIAFIGIGLRGTNHLNNAIHRKDTEITAICDVDPKRIEIALDLIEKEDFTTQAREKGARLLTNLKDTLGDHPNVGDVRGLGMMCAVEIVKDKSTREEFDALK